jgi:queuine tRNA-ribosyltransferase
MGAGPIEDLLEYTKLGIDMFDCVIPTRDGRTGTFFTEGGKIAIKNNKYKEDFSPIDSKCNCYTCRNFSRAYIRHLFNAGEIAGQVLGTLHNVHFFIKRMKDIRKDIVEDKL